MFHNLAGNLILRGGSQCPGMGIIRGTLHAGVAIIQENDGFQSQQARCTPQFIHAPLCHCGISLQVLLICFTSFTTGCTDEMNIHPAAGIHGKRSTCAKGFIIRMRKDNQQYGFLTTGKFDGMKLTHNFLSSGSKDDQMMRLYRTRSKR